MAHRIPLVLGAALVAAACTVGQTARAENVPTVAPTEPEHPGRVEPLLVMTGAVLFGIPYGVSIPTAITSDINADKYLYIPVGGPVVDLIVRNTCSTPGCKGDVGTVAAPLIIDALAQAGGVAVLVTAFTSPGRPPVSALTSKAEPPRPRVRVMPTGYAGGGGGITAFGTF